jgi:hypothetical protein
LKLKIEKKKLMKSNGKGLKKRGAISQLGVITKSFINGFAKRQIGEICCA